MPLARVTRNGCRKGWSLQYHPQCTSNLLHPMVRHNLPRTFPWGKSVRWMKFVEARAKALVGVEPGAWVGNNAADGFSWPRKFRPRNP
jgi:hypothetical protein